MSHDRVSAEKKIITTDLSLSNALKSFMLHLRVPSYTSCQHILHPGTTMSNPASTTSTSATALSEPQKPEVAAIEAQSRPV